MFEVITNNEQETRLVGEKIANELQAGATILLFGDLGSGKTVISSGIVKGCSGKDYNVTSPTFNIVQEYLGNVKVNHFDLYRIEDLSELENIGVYEYLFDESAVNIVEWPERAEELENLLSVVYKLNIDKIDEKTRKIRFEKIKG